MYNLFTLLPTEIIDYIWFLVHKTYANNLKMTNAVLIRHERLWSSLSFKNVDRDVFDYREEEVYLFQYSRTNCQKLKFKNTDFRPFKSVYYKREVHQRWASSYYLSLVSNHFNEHNFGDNRLKSSSYGKSHYCSLWDSPSDKFVYSLQCMKFCNKGVIYEKLAECLGVSVDELSKITKYKYTKNTKTRLIKHIMAL